MKLAYAIPADFAEFSNGKLSVIGGEFDTIRAARFPVLHRGLTLIVKLDVDSEEVGRDHILSIGLLTPEGGYAMPTTAAGFNPQPNIEHPERPVKALFALNFTPLIFETPGRYEFRLAVDDEEVGSIPLFLEADPSLMYGIPTRNTVG